ncbi:MAG TPA: hypothetical protein DDY78_01150 [Planctomycetales bacterium]|nr:hypothetical protein [Planctomycetales bacterium]
MEAGTDETQTNPLREQAEVIFAAAANALSLAAKEVRVEQDGDAKGETKAIATTPEDAFGQVLAWEKRTGEDLKTYHQAANREAAVRNAEAEVKKAEEAKGQTQKARIEAEAAKQKLRLAEDRRRKAEKHLLEAQEALKQAEGERGEVTALRKATTAVYGSRFQLALAERRLFEAAAAYLKGKGDNERSESCSRAADAAKREEQRASRELHRVQSEQSEAEKGANPEDPLLDEAREKALEQNLVGLSLSGGGIRSGTFALGVLQGLAQLRLLGMVDYLSTVSGGGYIGSWFAAWVFREGSLKNVERQLSPNRVSQSQARRTGLPRNRPVDPEPEPVHHLRAYSRYLSPRVGPYSTDTWALLVIYLRNLFVNSLFIIPLAVLAVFLWRMLLHGYDGAWIGDPPPSRDESSAAWVILTIVFVIAFFTGVFFLFYEEENLFDAGLEPERRRRRSENYLSTHFLILGMFLVMAVTGPWLFSIDPNHARSVSYEDAHLLQYSGQSLLDAHTGGWPSSLRFSLAFIFPTLALTLGVRSWGWLHRTGRLYRAKPVSWWAALLTAEWNWKGFLADLCLAFCFGAAFFGVLNLIWLLSFHAAHDASPDLLCHLLVAGPPLILAAMVVAGFVEMGLVGRLLNEYEREWRARLGACLLMGAAAWLVFGAATLYLPWLVEELFRRIPYQQITPATLRTVLTTLWAAVSGGGAWAATRPAATDPTQPGAWWVRPLTTVAPVVFLLGLIGGVSGVGQAAIDAFWAGDHTPSFLQRVTQNPIPNWCLIGGAAGMCLLFSGLIQVNRFSMHFLYANRLTRCYLGASRRKAALSALRAACRGRPRAGRRIYSLASTPSTTFRWRNCGRSPGLRLTPGRFPSSTARSTAWPATSWLIRTAGRTPFSSPRRSAAAA